ncbi:predicted protein [Plenodomus lingam JN3]|uniref:Uncharacterized protein n=1 Tax=Leptosphaeria maculans (strain JN3 / isolate v23.1.3 / race Av1-4-5-6-7-8) TaxID=985895 RepID=E4ZGQ6_LEPMJ|nr:predicted protein [Plenodomus lingam JN3]CBX90476.1 predicted protein [Plenodomus lingam JN3]
MTKHLSSIPKQNQPLRLYVPFNIPKKNKKPSKKITFRIRESNPARPGPRQTIADS